MKFSLIFFLSALLLLSCNSGDKKKSTDLVTFPLKGEVVKIDKSKKRISIAHEEIPDYMEAMTMPFKVKDTTYLDAVHVGDSITATLAVSRTESWLEGIVVVGKGEATMMTPEDVMFKKLYGEGKPLPDLEFVNQAKKTFRFGELKGKAVALTFIYTRCPLPDFCIRMSDQFSRVQRTMKKDGTVDGRWHLVTVSFDPNKDTPAVLTKYGEQYNADFRVWDFVTAPVATIQQFAAGFDLYVADGEGGLIDHNLRTALIDKEGRLVKVIKGNEWQADEVVAELKALARK